MNFKGSVYWKIYADIWGFHKKFADVKGDDSYWEQVVNDAGELYKKYEKRLEGEFAKKLKNRKTVLLSWKKGTWKSCKQL